MTEGTAARSAHGLRFTIETNVAGDLPFGATRADALVTVRARPVEQAVSDAPLAVVLVMDTSLSMADGGKLGAAREAVCAAVDALRDGTHFGIVAGNHEARTVFPAPPAPGLVQVDAAVRKAAKQRLHTLWAEGGTTIGSWLTHAGRLLDTAPPGAVRYAALYTDGRNEHETPARLDRVLAQCADRFVCDARGLGDDWDYRDLLRITEALHGSARAVHLSGLTEDLTRLMRQTQQLRVPRVYLGLVLDRRFRLGSLRQTRPTDVDLTAQQQRDGRTVHIPLGAWGAATRQYRLSLRFDADTLDIDEDLRAASISLLAESPTGTREPCADARPMVVRRHAYRDPLPARPEELTRAENAHQLGRAMRECAKAHANADFPAADQELRRAMALARDLDDTARLSLLGRVATTDDQGEAALRRDVTRGEMQRVGLESTRKSPAPAKAPEPMDAVPEPWDAVPVAGPVRRVCGACGAVTEAPVVRHCENCRRTFDDDPAEAS
ncbi:VWA domain-containing protein [Streptomyces sp. NPDC047042]|uniref:VWA domain-containing protein n=1 Tax=Streptomyces sp. NPDC047042 TaxID=3154807 RepID=UPI0034083D2B